MITRIDISDVLAMLTGNASDKTPAPHEITIQAWLKYFQERPTWTRDDLVAAADRYCQTPRERLVQPVDLGRLITAAQRDHFDRADPDAREQVKPLPPGARRDAHGYIDKSKPDDAGLEQNPEPEKRQQAAADDVRVAAMAAIHTLFNKTSSLQADGESVDVNPINVRCPFCGSAPFEPCTIAAMSGRTREPMSRSRAHPSRTEASAKAMGMTEQAVGLLARADEMAVAARYRADHPTPRHIADQPPEREAAQ